MHSFLDFVPIQVITGYRVQFPGLYNKFSLVIYVIGIETLASLTSPSQDKSVISPLRIFLPPKNFWLVGSKVRILRLLKRLLSLSPTIQVQQHTILDIIREMLLTEQLKLLQKVKTDCFLLWLREQVKLILLSRLSIVCYEAV